MTKRQRIITIILIALGALILVFFGMRTVRSVMRMRGHGPFGKPPAANQTDAGLIRDWMTVSYVAHTYDVPPDALFMSLQIPQENQNGRKSLADLNAEYYPNDAGVVLAHVQAAIQAMQKQDPPPPFPATPIFTPTMQP